MDDSDALEPIAIDDRTGGQRIVAGGRASLDRIGGVVGGDRITIVPLLWMLFLLAGVGANIYDAFDFSNAGFSGALSDGWFEAQILATTGGAFLAVGCLVGVALAVLFHGSSSRLAEWLAVAGGLWVVVAGALEVAVANHSTTASIGTISLQQRGSGTVVGLANAGLGLVVMAVAWRCANAEREPVHVSGDG